MGVNTEYCFDMNGSQEFKCECNVGFDGKMCELSVCPLNCENNGVCSTEIDSITNIKLWKCDCPSPFTGYWEQKYNWNHTDL